MDKSIYIGRIWKMMEENIRNKENGKDESLKFSISYIKRSTGEVVHYPEAILTSFHSKGSTINVMVTGEDKVRKIRRCLIVMFNDQKIYL